MSGRLILKQDGWPAADRAAWSALFREGGVFDDAGPCQHWKEGSRAKRRQTYGAWLGFLKNAGILDPDAAPADRITPATVEAFIKATRARVSLKTTAMYVEDLYVLATQISPERGWSWLRTAKDHLRAQTSTWRLKPRAAVTAGEIFGWALAEMAAAEGIPDTGGWRRPLRFRDGLMVGLLIARPVRLRAFIGMEVGRHLVDVENRFVLRFVAEDMKDHRAREYTLPDDLQEPMARYLDAHRPALLGSTETAALWVSRRGGALSRDGLVGHLWNITQRAFGEGYRTHAFRHIAATSIAEEDPGHVNIVASVLGHATLQMSERHYNRATGVKAAAAWQEAVRERRLQARRKARGTRRLSPQASIDDDESEA